MNEYVKLKSIYETNLSEVALMQSKTNPTHLVIFKRNLMDYASSTPLDEYKILRKLNHPNIVKPLDYVPNEKIIILQYIKGKDLIDLITECGNKNEKLDEEDIHRYFVQIISALEHCHNNGYVHRDIKLENIMINNNNNAILVDFGFAIEITALKNSTTTNMDACGTIEYVSPEIINSIRLKTDNYKNDPKPSDIWALGVVLFALFTFKMPFEGKKGHIIFEKVLNDKLDLSAFTDENLKYLLKGMLHKDPSKRFTTNQIKKSKWYNKYNKKNQIGRSSSLSYLSNAFKNFLSY